VLGVFGWGVGCYRVCIIACHYFVPRLNLSDHRHMMFSSKDFIKNNAYVDDIIELCD